MQITYPQYIIAAVEWWTAFITKPAIGDRANGAIGEEDGFASVLMSFAKASVRTQVSTEAIERFKECLAASIAQNCRHYEQRDGSVTISTDWYPEMELAEACQAAGISGTEFPSKTIIWIYPQKQKVVTQIGRAETVSIFPQA